MFIRSVPVFISLFLSVIVASAQDKCPVRFGHVSPEDFSTTVYNIDSSANGVIIADVGSTVFETNGSGGFELVYRHQRRIKIINKKGFDLADVAIHLYIKNNNEEKLEGVRGVTYNLENGKVVETKLNSSGIFEVANDKNHITKKFTMPAIKEGSIIEYSYTIKSPYIFNFRSWDFQGTYPRIWSEYKANIPEFFWYVILSQGYESYYKNTQETTQESYIVHFEDNTSMTLPGKETDHDWVMRNVPALKEEKFTSSINNFIAKIEFQLSSIQYPNRLPTEYMGTWQGASDDLLKDDNFGKDLGNNNWLSDDMKMITLGDLTDEEKARAIYYYVKDNIQCVSETGLYSNKSIKETFKDKNGSVADVNLLLIAMLRYENLKADPVILSTKEHGYTNTLYPLISKFNYVVCQLSLLNTIYYLDASKSYLGFNKLPENCYNGQARVINKSSVPVYFSADSLHEKELTIVTLSNDSLGWEGRVQLYPGYYESCDMRKKIAADGKDNFITKIKLDYGDDASSVSNILLKNLDSCEKPLKISYKVVIDEDNNADIIYFNPMLKEGDQENYFKSAERKYPVEMPYAIDETYILNIAIPKGYQVDELPKSIKVLFKDEANGFFEYITSSTETSISLRSHIKLERAIFGPQDYQALRNFFDYVVKKHSEEFVFKKKTK